MSVRDSLLGILTLGPAYGLQLRDELVARAPHRQGINVGQIYGTLDRLELAGFVATGPQTGDRMPRYTLTETGSLAAERWLLTVEKPSLPEWTDMLDQVLLCASLPERSPADLIRGYQEAWAAWVLLQAPAQGTAAQSLVRGAAQARADAAVGWLTANAEALCDVDSLRVEHQLERPRRGRPTVRRSPHQD